MTSQSYWFLLRPRHLAHFKRLSSIVHYFIYTILIHLHWNKLNGTFINPIVRVKSIEDNLDVISFLMDTNYSLAVCRCYYPMMVLATITVGSFKFADLEWTNTKLPVARTGKNYACRRGNERSANWKTSRWNKKRTDLLTRNRAINTLYVDRMIMRLCSIYTARQTNVNKTTDVA